MGFQGAQIILSLGSWISSHKISMDGTNANFHENLLTSDADVQTVNTLHGTQKTAVLNTNPVFIYYWDL